MSGRGFDEFADAAGFGAPGFGDAELRRRKLREIQDVAGELRRPVEAPDLSAAILARVDEERPFTTPRTRRLVWISRVALAASLGVASLGIALLHRSAPDLVQLRHQPQPFSDVVQVATTEASAGYQSLRTTLSSVSHLAAAGDRTLVGRHGGPGASAEARPAVWTPASDTRLAPLPPSYGATYVSLSPARPLGAPGSAGTIRYSDVIEAPVVVSTVRLAPGLTPRALASDAQPSLVYWGVSGGGGAGVSGGLSTAPTASMRVPVVMGPGELRRAEPVSSGAAYLVERRVLDSLTPASAGIGSGEAAVPR